MKQLLDRLLEDYLSKLSLELTNTVSTKKIPIKNWWGFFYFHNFYYIIIKSEKMKFKDLTKEQIIEICKLAFGFPEFITSDFNIEYCPYVEEHYSDAREYFNITFESKNFSFNRFEITPELNVWRWINEKPNHVLNQKKIQDKFKEFGL